MARRTTDLLDVFRERAVPARPAGAAPKAPGAPKRPFEGLFLYPRQLLLGSSVVVLLLVFAFVLGLSMGRRGASGTGDALQATTGRGTQPPPDERQVYALGRVPYTDPGRQIANEPAQLHEWLTSVKRVAPERAWIRNDEHGKQWLLILGPFAGESQAMDYLIERGLVNARKGGTLPFASPGYPRLRPSDLQGPRIPAR